ncbi:MAG: histone deacetylase family protein [Pseudoprimorskyibacter sp.]|nr:histone deacetylase family protein [Pseudoprimorskyibacter sp.]
MKAVFDTRQMAHDPKTFLRMGQVQASPEQPERARRLQSGAATAGWDLISPKDYGLAPIAAVHGADYLAFLQTIHARWVQMPDASAEVIPNIHSRSRSDSYPSHPVGQAGWHQADMACPIGADTWASAYWSAQSALTAAEFALDNGASYALCRPPGHHAFSDMAGGFCFLNNAAIAAQWMTQAGRRVAVLDVDVHHGNGTQEIFYERSDILTASVHADAARFYPFFWGHPHERGAGAGLGANLNLSLPLGSEDSPWLHAIERALGYSDTFGADCLVVALGLDAHVSDPFNALRITTQGFGALGRRLARCGKPVVLIQEGGYLSDALSENLAAVLGAFEE